MDRTKVTIAERQRRMAAEKARLQALTEPAPPLADHLEDILTAYVPRKTDPDRWNNGMGDFVLDVIRRGQCQGTKTVRQILSEFTLYVDWALNQGHEMTMDALLDHGLIDQWAAANSPGQSRTTWGNRRSRLRNLASHANPSTKSPARSEPFSHRSIKAPYTLREVAALERLALSQPTATLRRQLCAMVGLGLGAGLSSNDLRYLTRGHVEHDFAGACTVTVPGDRPRAVPVRDAYYSYVLEGIKGVKDDALILGREPDRDSITSGVVERAAIGTTSVAPDQARMRSTWILVAMTSPMSLATLMTTAGLTSGRTLTDLLPYANNPAYVVIGEGC